MNIDYELVLKDMYKAMKKVAGGEWENIQDACENMFKKRQDTALLLAKLRAKGKLSKDDFESEVEDEILLMEAQTRVELIKVKAIAQKAANAAMEVLVTAIKEVI